MVVLSWLACASDPPVEAWHAAFRVKSPGEIHDGSCEGEPTDIEPVEPWLFVAVVRGVPDVASLYWRSERRSTWSWRNVWDGMERSPQMIITRLFLVFILGPLVLLAGCTALGPKEELPLKRVTVEDLTALLRQRDAAVSCMKGLFSVKVRGGLIPILSRVEGTVYYRRPNALRLKGFTPLGGEVFEFVQADEWYRLRLPMEGKVYTGSQTDLKDQGHLARFSQLSAWAIGGLLGANALAREETAKLVLERSR